MSCLVSRAWSIGPRTMLLRRTTSGGRLKSTLRGRLDQATLSSSGSRRSGSVPNLKLTPIICASQRLHNWVSTRSHFHKATARQTWTRLQRSPRRLWWTPLRQLQTTSYEWVDSFQTGTTTAGMALGASLGAQARTTQQPHKWSHSWSAPWLSLKQVSSSS